MAFESPTMSREDACKYLGISSRSMYTLTKSGKIRYEQYADNGPMRFTKEALDEFRAEHTVPTRKELGRKLPAGFTYRKRRAV